LIKYHPRTITCWNLNPVGYKGVNGLLSLLKVIKINANNFSFSIDNLSGMTENEI